MTDRQQDIPRKWRERADYLERYAALSRRVGDTQEAMDAEAAARDYRLSADSWESQHTQP